MTKLSDVKGNDSLNDKCGSLEIFAINIVIKIGERGSSLVLLRQFIASRERCSQIFSDCDIHYVGGNKCPPIV